MDLTLYTLRSVAYAIVEPTMALMLIIIGIMFYVQNKKTVVMQKMIIGEGLCSPLELTLSQMVLGVLAGAVGSLILTNLGVMFYENSAIEILFMVSILLMFYRPRFFCFSYSAAFLGAVGIVMSVIYGSIGQQSPLKINVTYLMTFVGVLHFIEGILVMIDGSKGAVPVFTNKDGKILGGFALRRYWALPIAIFVVLASKGSIGTESLETPSWWPLLNNREGLNIVATSIVGLVPYYGIIGYNSITFTKSKKGKILQSGAGIMIYGILLILVSQLAKFGLAFEIIAVLFAPLAHEGMIYIQRKLEEKRAPLFLSDEEGMMILEVAPSSPAFLAGIRSGDKIIEINKEKVKSEIQVYKTIKESYFEVCLKIKDSKGRIKEYNLKPDDNRRIGVVLVPLMVKQEDVIAFDKDKFQDVLDNLKNKDK
jgi:hypothetical protein